MSLLRPLSVALVVLCYLALPTTASAQHMPGMEETAYLVPPGRVELGLLSPSRIALTNSDELSTHLLGNVLPHLSLKHSWGQYGPWWLSTKHTLSYPTLFFDLTSREGTGGLFPATTNAPFTLALDNQLLLTRKVGQQHLTWDVGVKAATSFGADLDALPLMDLPFLYARLNDVYTFATFRTGLSLGGTLAGPFEYIADLDAWALPAIPGGFALETGGSITWRPGRAFALALGYRASFAKYPYGTRLHILPYLDLQFAIE
jgi:hypothetical protein